MYNLRTLENPMLLTNFLRWLERLNPGADILSLIDPTLEPQEALREIKRRYPHIIIEKPPEDDFLSVNCFIKPVDMRYSVSECLYCHKPCKAERSTKSRTADGSAADAPGVGLTARPFVGREPLPVASGGAGAL